MAKVTKNRLEKMKAQAEARRRQAEDAADSADPLNARIIIYRHHDGPERPWDDWPGKGPKLFMPDDGRGGLHPSQPVWEFVPGVGWRPEGGEGIAGQG